MTASESGGGPLVSINPDTELVFKGPLNVEVSVNFAITNLTDGNVAFKLKTTAPKRYCVRPNAGVIAPKAVENISILMQPHKEPLPDDFICKDKFLVQTTYVSKEEVDIPIADLWPNIEASRKLSIRDVKLKVTYLPPLNGVATESIHPNSSASHTSASVSPGQLSVKTGSAAGTSEEFETVKESSNHNNNTAKSPVPTVSGSSNSDNNNDSEALKKANEKIAILQRELKGYQEKLSSLMLQQAKNANSATTANGQSLTAASSSAVTSYSNQISPIVVVIIALIAYLIGRLF